MDEVKLPVIQDTCPSCGAKEGVVQQILDKLITEKKISPGEYDKLGVQFPLAPKIVPTILTARGTTKVPVVCMFFEVCAVCKTFYVHQLSVIEQEAPVYPRVPPGSRA